MANKKPKTFIIATVWPSGMVFYFQPGSGPEEQVSEALLFEKLETEGFIKAGSTVSKSDNDTIAVAAGTYIVAIILTPSTNLTVSVGTTADGTDIIDSEAITTAGASVFVVNQYFAASGSLHFTLNTGSVTVHLKKL